MAFRFRTKKLEAQLALGRSIQQFPSSMPPVLPFIAYPPECPYVPSGFSVVTTLESASWTFCCDECHARFTFGWATDVPGMDRHLSSHTKECVAAKQKAEAIKSNQRLEKVKELLEDD